LNCPNVKEGGMSFSCNPDVVFKIVKAVRQATRLSVIAKVMPGVIDVVTLAKICKEAGADGIRPSAGQVGMAIDINTWRSKLGKNLTGGLGGPALKPVAIRHVWQVSRAVDITIVGGTGITCAEDAIEFFLAGATAVEIGSHNLIDHRTMLNVIDGIRTYLSDKGLSRMEDIIGKMIVP
jgi:dihydroorotate dehydrogenase (NAD+) catalytic subunit